MADSAYTLNPYELKVDEVIKQLVTPYGARMDLFSGTSGATGYYWELAPKSPGAAKAHVYAVGPKGINLSVENFYWVSIRSDKGGWDDALLTMAAYVQAILDGRVEGWYASENGRAQYVLEFAFPDGDAAQYTSNVRFANSFKDDEYVYHVQYQKY